MRFVLQHGFQIPNMDSPSTSRLSETSSIVTSFWDARHVPESLGFATARMVFEQLDFNIFNPQMIPRLEQLLNISGV